MSHPADRHLLFGLLALHTGLIRQDQLVAAFHAWTLDKDRPIDEHLIALGHLNEAQKNAIAALAAVHAETHGGDVEQSLAALTAGNATLEQLTAIADPDLGATLTHVGRSAAEAATGSASVGAVTADERRFQVLRHHAQGGLGAVYVALDSELNREVALKQLLANHADNPVLRGRFLIEAEITGGLEHPGIVPVYGLGKHDDGRPYYAMRFILGKTLKETVDQFREDKKSDSEKSLDFRRLLKNFTDICNAIDYAHSRGVLHRDIKPGNVIVGNHGETLVVDWGLAKALGHSAPDAVERTLIPSSSDGSSETLPGQALGTPAYMSPEQARGDLEKLGPRSDVYSLGATLYYLLTGQSPFSGKPEIILKAVEVGDLQRPRERDGSIDPALEAIVLKAMAKEPASRYTSAKSLAVEIDRWLADERVEAYPEPWTRTLNRWLTRHRTGVTSLAAAGIVALIGLGIVSTVQTKARHDLDAKNAELIRANADLDLQRKRAEENEAQAIDAVKQFTDVITNNPQLKDNPELDSLRKALLQEPLAFFGMLRKRLQADNDTRPESLSRLADVAFSHALLVDEIGDKQDAIATFRQALEIFERLARDQPTVTAYLSNLAASHNNLGNLLRDTGHTDEARTEYERAIVIKERLARDQPTVTAHLADLAQSHNNLGSLLSATGQPDAARAAHERALAIGERLTRDQPTVTRYQAHLADSHNNLGNLFHATGHADEARTELERAIAIEERLARDQPTVTAYLANLAVRHNNLGALLRDTGHTDEARAAYERAIAIKERLVRDHPTVTAYLASLAASSNDLGVLLSSTGQGDAARAAHERAIAIRERLARDHPTVNQHQADLAASHNNLGDLLRATGHADEARTEFTRAIAIEDRLAHDHPTVTQYQANLAGNRSNLGLLLRDTGHADEARAEFERAIAIEDRLARDHPTVIQYQANLATNHCNLGNLLRDTGHADDARTEFARAIAILDPLARDHPTVTQYQADLAVSHVNLGNLLRADEARTEFERAIAIWDRLALDHPTVTQYQADLAAGHVNLGNLFHATGHADEARTELERAIAILEQLALDHPTVTRYQVNLAASHSNIGSLLHAPDAARAAYERAIEIQERLAGDHPDSPEYASVLGGTLNNLATIELGASHFAEAREQLSQAITWQKKALEANPRNPQYRQFFENHLKNLIQAERGLNHEAEAAQAERELVEFRLHDPRFEPLNARLKAVREGDPSKDTVERLALGQRAYDTRQFHLAARLWAEALDADPRLAEDRRTQHAYNAACAAALATDGQGDDPPGDDAEMARLRGKALGWLQSERAIWAKFVEAAPPQVKPAIAQILQHWQKDADLASIRDPEPLAKLPEAEQAAWKAFWDEVEALLKRASAPPE